MKKYQLFITIYDLFLNDYIIKKQIIETDNIYYSIGFIYCNTLEAIKDIRYYEIKK